MANENKRKLTDFEKARLIYTIELLLFALIFIVLGILFLTRIIPIGDWKRIVFTYLTLAGGVWLVADFIWALASQKRRKKIAMIDKILVFPVGVALMVFDIYALIVGIVHSNDISEEFITLYRLVIGIDLLYIASVYIFEAIYHWFKPVPALLEEPETKPAETPVDVKAQPKTDESNSDSLEDSKQDNPTSDKYKN